MSEHAVESRYASGEEEARDRFATWRSTDPFPKIDPALLGAADVADYVAATGLIHPFDEAQLKPASYALPLAGKILWWDNKSRKRRLVTLKRGSEFELQPNSIAFVTLEPLLQLPDYIALRFNLRIQNIYRGLLLGTGPLVDPGFVGRLSFPLHNLTTNAYHFEGGENVVWVEFTKLSRNPSFDGDTSSAPVRVGTYRRYSPPADRSDVEDYVREALKNTGSRHIWSSISEALSGARAAVRRATFVNVAGAIALVVLALSVLGVVVTIFLGEWGLPRTSDLKRDEARITQLRNEVAQLRAEVRAKTTAPAKKK